MSGEKIFSTSLFGFKKKNVNSYIEKLNSEYEEKFKQKEKELLDVKNQYRDIKNKYEELRDKVGQVDEERGKIANVLLSAQTQAEIIVQEARKHADEEIKEIELKVQLEREKLVDIKKDIKVLKEDIIDTLKKYENELNEIIPEDA